MEMEGVALLHLPRKSKNEVQFSVSAMFQYPVSLVNPPSAHGVSRPTSVLPVFCHCLVEADTVNLTLILHLSEWFCFLDLTPCGTLFMGCVEPHQPFLPNPKLTTEHSLWLTIVPNSYRAPTVNTRGRLW